MRNLVVSSLRVLGAAAAVAALIPGAAQAGAVSVTNGWIRALPGNAPAGGYFELANGTAKAVVLTGASSSACGMLMLHKTEETSGMASMDDVAQIPVAAGAHLSFAPGGYHLMCMDPTAAIRPGGRVAVTLSFADGSKVTADFAVRNATGR